MNYLSSQIYILFCKNDYFGVHALCIPKERTHIPLARETTNRLLPLRNTFVYGMTSLLFDKLLKHKASSRQVSEVDESLFPAFHRVRISALGRFTLSMTESSCRSLYARRVASPLSYLWTRPFFYDWH